MLSELINEKPFIFISYLKHLFAFLQPTTPRESFCSPLVDYKKESAETGDARREIEILQKTSKTNPTRNHNQ